MQDSQELSTTNKNNVSRSPIWNYFKRVYINGVCRAQCLHIGCTKAFSIPNRTTSPLHKHLRNVHRIYNLKKQSNGRVATGRVRAKLLTRNKRELDNLAIVKDKSFNDFYKAGLKHLLQNTIPGNNNSSFRLVIFYVRLLLVLSDKFIFAL